MEKFKIPEKQGLTHRNIAVPKELVDKINKLLSGRSANFSDFTVAALEYAVKTLEEQSGEQN